MKSFFAIQTLLLFRRPLSVCPVATKDMGRLESKQSSIFLDNNGSNKKPREVATCGESTSVVAKTGN